MARWVVGMTGASGAIYGVRLLQALHARHDTEVELVVSQAASLTLAHETPHTVPELAALATHVHDEKNIGATIASGSYRRDGMVVAPCSIKTMSCIAHSLSLNLIHRAADVTLKERKPLILLVRETPLHAGHLESMLALSRLGAVIVPAAPSFYHQPRSVDDLVDGLVTRLLDLMGLPRPDAKRWAGLTPPPESR
ncbi:MAG TPA: UbiX family flavin prenyltransferase [Candidatus Xenobia bacterium]